MSAPPNLGHLARAELDPLLMPLGFQSGQWGVEPSGNEGVTFCAPQEVLDYHFLPLGMIAGQFPEVGGGCLDLVIEGRPDSGITRVELEGHRLSDLLVAVGQDEQASLVMQWPGETVDADLVRVRRAMTFLLRTSADRAHKSLTVRRGITAELHGPSLRVRVKLGTCVAVFPLLVLAVAFAAGTVVWVALQDDEGGRVFLAADG